MKVFLIWRQVCEAAFDPFLLEVACSLERAKQFAKDHFSTMYSESFYLDYDTLEEAQKHWKIEDRGAFCGNIQEVNDEELDLLFVETEVLE